MSGLSQTQMGQLSDGLYTNIMLGIMIGEFPPGAALPPELTLADRYGISRAVVRKALRQLKDEGIVESRQGSGTVVNVSATGNIALQKLSRQLGELSDCLICRLAIEPEVAALVAERQNGVAMDYLREQLARLEWGTVQGQDLEKAWSDNEAQFHIRLAVLSENRHFASIMSALKPQMLFTINTAKLLPVPSRRTQFNESVKEHLAIVKCVLDGDSGSSRRMMWTHISNARRRLFARFNENAE